MARVRMLCMTRQNLRAAVTASCEWRGESDSFLLPAFEPKKIRNTPCAVPLAHIPLNLYKNFIKCTGTQIHYSE